MNNITRYIAAAAFLTTASAAFADGDIKDTEFNPITTGVTSLSIAPDARGASMGDIGAATEPDANSQFWNPSKYAFAYSSGGVSLNYLARSQQQTGLYGSVNIGVNLATGRKFRSYVLVGYTFIDRKDLWEDGTSCS